MSDNAKEIGSATSRMALGAVLLVAGFSKIGTPESLARTIANYQLLPESLSPLAATFVPWLEIAVGACLLLGHLTRAAAFLAGVLSVFFGIFVGSALARGLNIECGCFSGASKVSWLHLAFDIVMIGLATKILISTPDRFSLDAKCPAQKTFPGKRALAASAVLLCCNLSYLVYFASKPGPETEAAAVLSFEPSSLNLGIVSQGADVEKTVVYRNSSTRSLEIVDIKTSCECTVPKPSKTTLAPGETSELTVRYQPKSNRGPIRQTIDIYVDGQEQPIALEVSGIVEPVIEVVPGLLEPRIGETKRFTLEGKKPGLKFQVVGIQAPPGLSVRQLSSTENSAEFELSLTSALPPLRANTTVWTVALKTDLEGLPPAILYLREPATK
jgi:uncharacterized membrane protein YphA (DoxX/SURF4 family)